MKLIEDSVDELQKHFSDAYIETLPYGTAINIEINSTTHSHVYFFNNQSNSKYENSMNFNSG